MAKKATQRNRGPVHASKPGKVSTPKLAARPRSSARRDVAVTSAAGPRLLSGGNPQIAKADGDAPVQAYIAAMPGWKSDLGRRLDALITQAVPGVRKAVRWNSPLYGVEGKGWFLGLHCLTKYVKVAFFKGAMLGPGLTGTPKSGEVRYLDIYEGERGGDFDESQFVQWVRHASTIDGWNGSSRS
jgi:hypothetical protein